ncbi:MAG: hypothetical protein U5Q44_13110 [Dehalococcoidia bacterium]|nr:hypothetical protein [Dehalococcoidia bacterium]
MIVRPFVIARYGIYLALAIAVLSALLATGAGTALDTALLRALFIFVLFTALAFGADAVVTTAPPAASTYASTTTTTPAPSVSHSESWTGRRRLHANRV